MNCILGVILAAAVTADPATHSVTFTATATGITKPAPLEFMFVGPGSDHDYESMFVTDADVADIAKAFDEAGISRGRGVDPAKARFWPVGDFIEMTPGFDTLVNECFGDPLRPISYTGGSREGDGSPVAATNMPLAVMAFYNLPQSLIQFDESLDQSGTYTRFKPAVQLKTGERMSFTFTLAKPNANIAFAAKFVPGNAADVVREMKEKSANAELDVTPSFSADLSLGEARTVSAALATLDSSAIKINGFADGEYFYQSYLPKEAWKDRKERLCQPPEFRYLEDGRFSVTEIKESWSKDESDFEPKLTPVETVFENFGDAMKLLDKLAQYTSTILVYAPDNMKLGELYKIRAAMKGDILNYYFL